MGIIHYAYLLNRKAVCAETAKIVDMPEHLRAYFYQDRVKRDIELCSEYGKQFLKDICFDEEDWTSKTMSSADRMEKWVKVALAKHIAGVHRLSQSSFVVLELILPKYGWANERVMLLLLGRKFGHLVKSLGCPDSEPLIDQFARIPSWLSFGDAETLMTELRSVEMQFTNPTETSLQVIEMAQSQLFLDAESNANLIRNAFSEMVQRLEWCSQAGHDLILINEVSSYFNKDLEPL